MPAATGPQFRESKTDQAETPEACAAGMLRLAPPGGTTNHAKWKPCDSPHSRPGLEIRTVAAADATVHCSPACVVSSSLTPQPPVSRCSAPSRSTYHTPITALYSPSSSTNQAPQQSRSPPFRRCRASVDTWHWEALVRAAALTRTSTGPCESQNSFHTNLVSV